MKTNTVLMLLLGLQRILTGFPYTVSLNESKIVSRKLLLLYSGVMVIALSVCYTYMAVVVMPDFVQSFDVVDRYMSLLVVIAIHSSFLVTMIYNLIRSSKLRDVAKSAIQLHVTLGESLARRFDWESIAIGSVTVTMLVYIGVATYDSTASVVVRAMSVLTSAVIFPQMCLTAIMYNVFIRLCTLYFTATFKHFEEATVNPTPTVAMGLFSVCDHKPKDCSVGWTGSALISTSNCESARRSLYLLDKLVMDINKHFGPLICLNLGTDLLMTITFLQALIAPGDSIVFIALVYVLLSCMKISLILNAPESFNKKVFPDGYSSSYGWKTRFMFYTV